MAVDYLVCVHEFPMTNNILGVKMLYPVDRLQFRGTGEHVLHAYDIGRAETADIQIR